MQVSRFVEEKATKILSSNAEEVRPAREAYQKLESYLDNLKCNKGHISAQEHEEALLRLTREIGQASMVEMLESYDVSDISINVNSQTYRRKHKAKKTYQTSLGSIEVKRHVYVNRKRDGNGKSICPLEIQAGIIAGYWSAQAAKNSAWLLGHLTPQETEDALLQLGMMNPSRSSLDRLPKTLLSSWDEQIVEAQKQLTENEVIPEEAVSMAVSLDGVMVGMKPQKKAETTDKNHHCEWKEASCGTVSFFDKEGCRLATTLYGRMPESKKKCLKDLLKNHVETAMNTKPNLKLLHIADGAKDNWTFFDKEMPFGTQLVDYYHACEYLKKAFNAAYSSEQSNQKYHKYKNILKEDKGGIKKVLRALRHLRDEHQSSDEIKTSLTYFTNNKHRMRYAQAASECLPIGSGIVEAACKSLVSHRMKRSGMSWNINGGQSILTLRALIKSNRFDAAWPSISKRYLTDVEKQNNVVNLFG